MIYGRKALGDILMYGAFAYTKNTGSLTDSGTFFDNIMTDFQCSFFNIFSQNAPSQLLFVQSMHRAKIVLQAYREISIKACEKIVVRQLMLQINQGILARPAQKQDPSREEEPVPLVFLPYNDQIHNISRRYQCP